MRYIVTLHYTTLASVEVSAESEEEGIMKALKETTIQEVEGQLLSNILPWFQTISESEGD
ncbi:MAG TPA: hypothetical protein ENH28_01615 [Euryarchaeota archaeon]|nr:hypothetical protein [Euryarchaeota archaeon]